jgi:hypothetical protein
VSNFDHVFDPGYSAPDLFVNRLPESQAFARALFAHAERVFSGNATLGDVARRNVLTFYGVGGIGKTELSRRLEGWLLGELAMPGEWGEPPRFDQDVRSVRVDFHGSGVVDPAEIVLKLRAAAAGSARRMAAFDLGFAAWWSLAHPGMPLPEIHGRAGTDVRAQMTDTLNDILSDAGLRFGIGPLTVRMGVRLIDAIRSRHLRGATLRQCAPLAAVIEEAQRDASPYVAATLAGLLSWDLEQLHPAQAPLLIAFADAVEYIQAADRSQERLFNRIVSLTPQIMWVITVRNSLDWDASDLIGAFPAVGPRTWPGLRQGTNGESRQHRVRDLAEADVTRYLRVASGSSGNPQLGTEVIDRIRSGAHGLPLYLDLSMTLARETGKTALGVLEKDDFGGPLPQLVARVFADLPEPQRDAARAASLLPRFDPRLIAEAAGGHLGDAERFCRRSMVSRDDHPLFPYRLHDTVRAAITDEPVTSQGAWVTADRMVYAGRLAEALRARHDEVPDIDHRREILELAAGLCADYDLRPFWLRGALMDLPGLALTAARLPPADDGTWIGQLSGFFRAWQDRNRDERVSYLAQFVSVPRYDDIDALARRWLAFTLRDRQGQAPEALAILRELLSKEPESPLLRYQVARTLRQLGQYDELGEHLDHYPLTDSTAAARIRSDLAYDRGELAEALQGAAARADYLRSIGSHRVALENASAALWRAALIRQASVADCDELITSADRYGLRSIMRQALVAKIVCLAGNDSEARRAFTEIDAITSAPTASPPRWREWAANLVHGLYTRDDSRIEDVRRQWDGHSFWSPNRQFIDRLFVYIGYRPTYPPLNISGDDHREIDRRWHAVIDELVRRGQQS